MDFLDNVINKAKDVIDIAVKKTEEVVTTEKQRFDATSLKTKREKDFTKLGKIYYALIKDDENAPEDAKAVVAEIREKTAEIDKINAEIAAAKSKRVCPACGAAIAENASFCSACGQKLIIED